VTFDASFTPAQVDAVAADIVSHGGVVHRRFTTVLNGFSATIPDEYLPVIQRHPKLALIEPEGTVEANPARPPHGGRHGGRGGH
jgi:hypothetical protein